MKLYDSVELAARNLRESVLRNSLTTLGIAVGVASLVAMLSLGVGLQRMASRRLKSSGLFDTVLVTSRRDMRAFNREQEMNGPSPAESPDLDDAARRKIENIPGVVEAYPELRFITELRYEDKPHLTMVGGMAFSSKDSDGFEGMQGGFFSSGSAHEAILQKSFAAELLGKTSARGLDEIRVADVGKPLLGKQIVMRYAERNSSAEAKDSASYSVISHELALTIVGVTDLDPDSVRGPARARLFIPEQLLEGLHVMQAYDYRDTTRATSAAPAYTTVIARVSNAGKVDSAGMGDWSRHQFRNKCLSQPSRISSGANLGSAVVAGCLRDGNCIFRQLGIRAVSRVQSRTARPGAGAAVRIMPTCRSRLRGPYRLRRS